MNLAGGFCWRTRVAAFALALFALSGFAGVHAQTLTPNVQRGVAWLNAQVQGDGTLATEATSTATPFQARQETQVTLTALASAPGALITNVAADTNSNVEYTARRIIAAGNAARSNDISALLDAQNADGGWGLTKNYQSDPLDTAFVLQALAAANIASPVIATGLGYLTRTQSSAGGWGVDDRHSVYITSNVLLAANAWSRRYDVAGMSSAASTWLLAQRDTTTQTFATTRDNAMALRVLATQTTQSAVLQPLVAVLDASQLADGSWADDPYLTALALRARVFQPSSPTTGDVRGMVVDRSTGLPIASATVQLVENSSSTSTANNGAFSFSGVAPGAYALRVSALGYQTASAGVPIVAGQITDLGSISLTPLPLTATLSGIVKTSNGNPLANAIVAVGVTSTLTDATGAYQIAGLSPGAATITASLANYQTVTANVMFVAGNSYLFSPTLYATNVTPPATSLRGTVVDGATGTAMANASVTLNGVATVTTAANGQFTFTNQTAGVFTLAVSAAGYTNITATGSMAAGANDIGKIALSVAPASSTLSGLVTDADTGAPIASASIAVSGQGLAGTTGADGRYSITDISGSTLTLYVSAPEYLTQTLEVTLP